MESYNKKYHPSVNSVVVAAGKSFFQPKLTINNPNDQYEQEADTVADKVMKMETPFVQKKSDSDLFFSPSPISITPVQRKCAHCEEEEKMQRKEIKGTIQRQTTPPAEESDIDVRRNPPGEKHDINDPPNLATFDLLDPLNSSVCYKGFCLPSTRSVINGLKKLKNSTGAKPVYNWPLPGLTKEQVRQAACKSIPSLCPPAAGTQTGIPNLTLPPIQLDIPRFQFFDHRIIDHFNFNKYDVPFRHKSLLDKTATELAANPDLVTNIIGHTDVNGGDEYNQALSENRAHAVEQYFLTANVPSSQIWTVNGMGKQQPRFTNDAVNAASASKNRRVELDIRKLIWNVSFTSAPSHTLQLQRKCAHCEEEENLQRKEIDEEEKDADSNLENYVGGLSGAGQPLPNEARNFYEPRFGYDFSNVKVHTDSIAAKSAQSINALAYTSGNNIVFNEGQYATNLESGKKLLAHELTHVVQQVNGIQRSISYDSKGKEEFIVNPAENIKQKKFHMGLTKPTMNDSEMRTSPNPLRDPKYSFANAACKFEDIKDTLSFKMNLPITKEWKTMISVEDAKKFLAASERDKLLCDLGQIPLVVKGEPDNKSRAEEIRKHELGHVKDLKQLYDTIFLPWSKMFTDKVSKGGLAASGQEDCLKEFYKDMSSKDELYKGFLKKFSELDTAYHKSDAGKPTQPKIQEFTCKRIEFKL
ncbi:MAG TPA: DUF4157 domain-containing protein [Chitinophagaceae bacterium]